MAIVNSLFTLSFLLGTLVVIICDDSTPGSHHRQATVLFESPFNWFQSPYKKWLAEGKGSQSETLDMVTLFREKTETKFKWRKPTLESSIVPLGESLDVPSFLRSSHKILMDQQESSTSSCWCDPISICYTTCTSYETRCGRTCAHVTAFTAEYYRKRQHTHTISTEVDINQTNCEDVRAACVASAAVAAAAVAAFAVIAAVGIGSGVKLLGQNQMNQIQLGVDQFLNSGRLMNDLIPINDLSIPVGGRNFSRNDSCGVESAHFGDGFCYALLSRGPCRNPYYWVTLDPLQLKARCTPRLCGRSRVFIGRDGLCHDIYDSLECRGGRRLYYSAYGDPVCDCPLGQYPFPTAEDNCVPLFQQGPCPPGNVVSFAKNGRLECASSQCPSSPDPLNPLIFVRENGFCYEWGTTGPCRPPTELLGYDVFQLKAKCVDLTDRLSPYFWSPEEDKLLDSVFDQLSAEYDDLRISFVQQIGRNVTLERRQEQNTLGVFQVSSSLPDVLLNPCRPGVQRSLNYKCTNPILPEQRRRDLLPAVRSPFRCSPNSFLQANAQCVNDNGNLNCGPSFRFSQVNGKCRSIFQP